MPKSTSFTSLIFKIQANMDPRHRDCLVFMRVCSGKFTPGLQVSVPRSGQKTRLTTGLNIFGQDRVVVNEAVSGDIIGVVDTAHNFRIGDTLTEEEGIEYESIPRFAPEHFARVTGLDPSKRKQLLKGIQQLSDEGVVQALRSLDPGDVNVTLGAVGILQFEVFQHRLRGEYGVEVRLERLSYAFSKWLRAPLERARAFSRSDAMVLQDGDGHLLTLFASDWALKLARDDEPDFVFGDTLA
jgi:peptide chain release factor 3